MPIIDAQVHAYERDRPERPWAAVLPGPDEVTGDAMIAAMDAANVDGAILVSPFTMYRYDASYAIDVYKKYPTRFRLVKPVDPTDPGVAETIADWAGTEGAVAIRMLLAHGPAIDADSAGVAEVMRAAARHGLPINLLCWGNLGDAAKLAAKHPDVTLVIDHLGLQQPFAPPKPDAPFADLPQVLDLAKHPNVTIKITGACTLSLKPYPYDDIWDPVRRIVDAYGIDHCMWGTDWTRAVNFLTYSEGVEPFRETTAFASNERAALMGGNLQRIYDWPFGNAAAPSRP